MIIFLVFFTHQLSPECVGAALAPSLRGKCLMLEGAERAVDKYLIRWTAEAKRRLIATPQLLLHI